MGLTAITQYGPGAASARVRVYEWLARFNTPHHLHCYIGAGNASPRTLARGATALTRAELGLRNLDLADETLLLHRGASPLSSGVLESQLLRSARRSVFDFDDALQWDVRHGLRGFFSNVAKAERCVKAADVVIAGSDMLADWASRFAAEVQLVPTCVEPDDYVVKRDYVPAAAPKIGWVGSRTTERYLQLVQDPLLALHHETGARLVVVSSGNASLGPLDVMVDRVPWDVATIGTVMSSFDIAIAPLTEELFARGKCAYKILQYAAAGLVIVGSPVGANVQVLGRLGAAAAGNHRAWLDGMNDLLRATAAERAALGAAARHGVERFYSFSAWEPAMARLLDLRVPALV